MEACHGPGCRGSWITAVLDIFPWVSAVHARMLLPDLVIPHTLTLLSHLHTEYTPALDDVSWYNRALACLALASKLHGATPPFPALGRFIPDAPLPPSVSAGTGPNPSGCNSSNTPCNAPSAPLSVQRMFSSIDKEDRQRALLIAAETAVVSSFAAKSFTLTPSALLAQRAYASHDGPPPYVKQPATSPPLSLPPQWAPAVGAALCGTSTATPTSLPSCAVVEAFLIEGLTIVALIVEAAVARTAPLSSHSSSPFNLTTLSSHANEVAAVVSAVAGCICNGRGVPTTLPSSLSSSRFSSLVLCVCAAVVCLPFLAAVGCGGGASVPNEGEECPPRSSTDVAASTKNPISSLTTATAPQRGLKGPSTVGTAVAATPTPTASAVCGGEAMGAQPVALRLSGCSDGGSSTVWQTDGAWSPSGAPPCSHTDPPSRKRVPTSCRCGGGAQCRCCDKGWGSVSAPLGAVPVGASPSAPPPLPRCTAASPTSPLQGTPQPTPSFTPSVTCRGGPDYRSASLSLPTPPSPPPLPFSATNPVPQDPPHLPTRNHPGPPISSCGVAPATPLVETLQRFITVVSGGSGVGVAPEVGAIVDLLLRVCGVAGVEGREGERNCICGGECSRSECATAVAAADATLVCWWV